jgi:hypothetical protein
MKTTLLLIVSACVCVVYGLPVPKDQAEEVGSGELFEGDIILDRGQMPWNRNAVMDQKKLWPNATVYYTVPKDFSE